MLRGMEAPRIAITGASGRLGGRVARRLSGAGTALRLVVRERGRAPPLPGAELRVASYGDAGAAARALHGIETLLFVSASESRDRLAQHVTFVRAAADAGVRHVVYTSFFGYLAIAAGALARVTTDVARVTGHAAAGLDEVLRQASDA